jgi:8-oxo-dGTP pyrophosphatase MutT (NUDIX family)
MSQRPSDGPAAPTHPRLSAHVFLLDGGRVLLVRRSAEAAFAPNLWHASAAGKVEPGEDVVAAATRECSEELGVRVEPGDLEFSHVMHSQEGSGWVHFFFVCGSWDGPITNAEPHKHTDMEWFPAHRPPEDTVEYCARALAHGLTGRRFSQHRTRTPFPARHRSAHGEPALGDAAPSWCSGRRASGPGASVPRRTEHPEAHTGPVRPGRRSARSPGRRGPWP